MPAFPRTRLAPPDGRWRSTSSAPTSIASSPTRPELGSGAKQREGHTFGHPAFVLVEAPPAAHHQRVASLSCVDHPESLTGAGDGEAGAQRAHLREVGGDARRPTK